MSTRILLKSSGISVRNLYCHSAHQKHASIIMDALPQVLNASPNWSAPVKQNALMQTTSKVPKDVNENAWQMQVTRNREGLGVPLQMAMELHAANQIGRLPFMNSSNMMRDVLLARDEMIDFTDVLGNPELFEFQNQPHATVEKMTERQNTELYIN